jgi:hypothetical protein
MNALVLLISCLMLLASLSLFMWTRKRLQAFQQQIQQQMFSDQVKDQIAAINAGSIGMGGRFVKLEKDLHLLATRFDELQSQMQANTPYAHAITLAQKGSSAEEIMELCGIGHNEAQLLLMMHGSNKAA